jgi:hypothetical protein
MSSHSFVVSVESVDQSIGVESMARDPLGVVVR